MNKKILEKISNFWVLLDNNYQVKQFKNMRRRTLLGGEGNIEYVFSAQTTPVYISYDTSSTYVNIKSTANGSNIGYSVVSYDGTVVTRVTTEATYVTIRYSGNSTYESRSGNVVLKQNDSNKTITITVSQDAQPLTINYGGILLDGTSGSNGSISFYSTVTFSNVPSWATVTYSDSSINVTATETNSSSTARLAAMTVKAGSQSTELVIIQLPSDYHSRSYVSIRGLNWAIKNVGASSVQDDGNYYQWGAGSTTYKYGENQYHTGGTDTSYTLPSSADTATQVMGSGWRMPTKSECQSLTANSYYRVSYNGVNGGVFNSSGNVLFFPKAGYHKKNMHYDYTSSEYVWSSTPFNSTQAYYLKGGIEFSSVYSNERSLGCSVRGVYAS